MESLFSGPLPIIITIVLGLVLIIACVLATWKKIPNDHAAVIVGTGKKPKVVTGGGTVVIPLIQRMDMITLETIPLTVRVDAVKTSLGVPINAEGYAIIKVKCTDEAILTAMQMFYCNNENMTKDKISDQAQELCRGKLREIVSAMTVEEIYDDRAKLSQSVIEVVSTALDSIGLELKSFTINDITDNDEYIESLGKAQIAKVKAEAAIAQAEATKEQSIKTAEANRIGEQAKIEAATRIAEAEKEKAVKTLAFKREQDSRKAEADAAYQIQENITKKDVTNTEMDAAIIEKQRAREIAEAEVQVEIATEQRKIELAEKQAARKEAELQATVIKPAEASKTESEIKAEASKIQSIKKAEAEAEAKKLDAKAEAERIKQQGLADAEIEKAKGLAEAEVIKQKGIAEAEATRLKGLAEAEALDKKAEALAKMDDAGKIQMVIEKLPEIAAAIAQPMSQISNMTIIGGGNNDGGATDVAKMGLGTLKAVIEGMKDTIGFDLTEVMKAQTFEGKTTKNINMNVEGLEGLTAQDLIKGAEIIKEVAEQKEHKDVE